MMDILDTLLNNVKNIWQMRERERAILCIEKINTTPAIILAKGLREALFMNRPVVKDIVFSLCNFGSWPIYWIDEAKIHSLDEPTVQDILVQLSNSQE